MKNNKFIERTLVLIKPDAVKRALIGSVIRRFERVGLKIIGLKITQATRKQLEHHFPTHDFVWIKNMGQKSIETYEMNGMDPAEEFGTADPVKIGLVILGWNFEYLLSGPLVAMVLEGVRAIATVRKIVGDTIPAKALPGTIRGDFSINSADYANSVQCSCNNVVHASGNLKEAETECNIWFDQGELVVYKRADEQVMFNKPQKKKKEINMVQIDNIETVFVQKKVDDPREAAELAYIIAMSAKAAGNNDKAVQYGKESVELFDQLNIQTLKECATKFVVVNGVAMPELIHADVVRNRLHPLQL